MTLPIVDTSRHNGSINGAKLKARGFVGIMARCVIGQAERDPLYLMAKEQAEDNGLFFAAYGVSWPINRNARADALNFVEKLCPSSRPQVPILLVGDHELGASTHPSGHHLLSGAELIEYGIEYNATVEQQTRQDCWLYTAMWYWNSAKLLPFVNRGEREFRVFPAHYPFDPPQVSGLPPRYSPDVLNPKDHSTFVPLVPKPWNMQDMAALQWTSKGRGAASGFCVSTFLDRSVVFDDLGGPISPPAATHEERISKLESEAHSHGLAIP